MMDEPFSRGDSFFHIMDPRAKLVAAAALALAIATADSMWPPGLGLAVGASICLVAGCAGLALIRRLFVVNTFIVFLWATIPFSTPGRDILLSMGPFHATREGVDLALLITLKANAVLLILIGLLATSPVTDIGRALADLKAPRKLCCLLLYTFRYSHVIVEEYRRLMTAARMRGFRPATNGHTYRTYANMAAMLLVRSWERAQRVDQAMRLRGFDGRLTGLTVFALRPVDTAMASALVLLGAALAWLPYL